MNIESIVKSSEIFDYMKIHVFRINNHKNLNVRILIFFNYIFIFIVVIVFIGFFVKVFKLWFRLYFFFDLQFLLFYCILMNSIKSFDFQIFATIKKHLTYRTMFFVFHTRNNHLFFVICHDVNDNRITFFCVFVRT